MTTEKPQKNVRIILGAGGVSALALVLLGILSKPAYTSVTTAAIMWSLASLSMIILGVTFIHVRRLFKTPVAHLVAALLFIKAALVVIPLFVVYQEAAGFMDALQHFRNGVDLLFLLLTAWVAFRGRKTLGAIFSNLITAALALASLGLLANHILLRLSGSVPGFLGWTIILSTLLGIAGLGVGFIWLAVRNPRP